MVRQIEIYDLEQKKVVHERVIGRSFLLFLYRQHSFTARMIRFLLCENSLMSRLFGFWQKLPLSKRWIAHFVKDYDVDMTITEKKEYRSFNDFFTRKLKPDARPIGKGEVIAFADARYLFYNTIDQYEPLRIKGQEYTLKTFLGDSECAKKYKSGSIVIARLAPQDYHRFHAPISGKIEKSYAISGKYDSVSPLALRSYPEVLFHNKRHLIEINSPKIGPYLLIIVGALNVASIKLTYTSPEITQGQELGYFSFGGSTVVLITMRRLTFYPELTDQTQKSRETFVNHGTALI